MSEYKKGKYVELLNNTLTRDEIIYLAKKFGLTPSGSDIHVKISKTNDSLVVYEELSSAVFSEILTSVVFSDFVVKPENSFEGTIEYAKAQTKYREYVADLAIDANEDYLQDFAMYLLEQERQISKKYEEKKQNERKALEQELGLAIGEFAPTK